MAMRIPDQFGSTGPVDGKCNGSITGTGPGFPDVPKRYCKNPPEPGRTRCKFHGGQSPRGLAHYQIRERRGVAPGQYSKDLPLRMTETFEAFLDDVDAGSVKGELALLRSMLAESIGLLSQGGPRAAWGQVALIGTKLRDARLLPEDAADQLDDLLSDGLRDDETLNKILVQVRLITTAADTENKRDFMREKAISTETFALTMTVLAQMIKRYVTDEEIVIKIFHELDLIMRGTGKIQRVIDMEEAPDEYVD